MLTRSRYALAGITVAASIVSLVTLGNHSLRSGSSSTHRNVILAGGATRTWVSGLGDDANPCSRTAPCKTFAGAYFKTGSSGEIDTLDPGGFGNVTISQAMTIDGLGGHKSSIVTGPYNGVTVTAGPNDVVTLRHLQIQGNGIGLNGIRFISGKALILEDVVIEGFTHKGIDASLTADGSSLTIRNSSIHNNAGAGVAVTTTTGSVRTTITGSELDHNHAGFLAGSGATVDIGSSVITTNDALGVGCSTSTALSCYVHTTHDQIDHNGIGISAAHNGDTATINMWLSDDDIFSNTVGISAPSAGNGQTNVYSFQNNRFVNNQSPGAPPGPVNQS